MKTIVIYSTDKLSYVIEKAGYKANNKHLYSFEIDVPEELMQQPKDRIVLPKKKRLKTYIKSIEDVQNWLTKELQKTVDKCK